MKTTKGYALPLPKDKQSSLTQDLWNIMHAGYPQRYIVVANRYGKVIKEQPSQEFKGLDTLINTGYVNE